MPAGFESDIFFSGAIQTKQSTVRMDGVFVLRTVEKRDLNGPGSE